MLDSMTVKLPVSFSLVQVVSFSPVVAFQHLTCRLSIPLQARPTHTRRRDVQRRRLDGGVEPAKVVVSVCTRDSLDKYWKCCAHGTRHRDSGCVLCIVVHCTDVLSVK